MYIEWKGPNYSGTLESSHEQEQTEKERRFQLKYKYWPRIIVICVILQARMIIMRAFSADDFLQTCYQDMLAQ